MRKRKIIATVLSIMVLMSLSLPAFAAPVVTVEPAKAASSNSDPVAKISKEKAIETAKEALKKHFSLVVDEKKYQHNMEYRKDWNSMDRYVWAMNWNLNDQLQYAHASVTVDAMTGEILEMSHGSGKYGDQPSKMTTLTLDEAQKLAEAFIEKVVPGKLSETSLMPMYDDYYRSMYGGSHPVFYNFNYVRLVNGAKYDPNYVNVGIDGATGEIRHFNYRWEDISGLPKPADILAAEEATKIAKDRLNLDLFYLPIRDEFKYEPNPKELRLVYRMNYNYSNMLDAKTGKAIDWNGKPEDNQLQVVNLTEKQLEQIKRNAKKPIKKDKEIDQERAQQLALAIIKDELGIKGKVLSSNYIEGQDYWEAAGRKAWNIEFTVEKEDDKKKDSKTEVMGYTNGRVMIDALTEELIALNYWNYYDVPYQQDFKPAITWEQGYNKAMDVIKKYYGDKVDQIKTEQVMVRYDNMPEGSMPPMEYYYFFPRKVNGVLFEENQINVSFNAKTGKIQNINCRWNEDMKFPPADKAISLDKARDIFYDKNELELAYFRFNTNNNYQNPVFDTKLVYRTVPKKSMYGSFNFIDAVTGKMVDYNGRPLPDDSTNNFDEVIKGHWIERTAKILVQQGIVEKSNFQPDNKITKMDVIKMLVKARGMDYYYPMMKEVALDQVQYSDVPQDSADFKFIHLAIRYGIIENDGGKFNGDAKVTREELAVMVTKLLRYEGLAKAKHIFNLSFPDKASISADLVGYVAICEGLGLIDGKNNFRPKDAATMAEVADVIYKALNHMNR